MNQETKNFEHERKILDSGTRRQFESGAVRDIAEGKGRCDLLPLTTIAHYMNKCENSTELTKIKVASDILVKIDAFIREGCAASYYSAISWFISNNYDSTITAFLELSKHYEEGAKKYAERNWEKGIPAHCYVDSAIRHLLKWADGWEDEPHDRAFLWNMFCLMWTITHLPLLNDLPYMKEEENE